MNKPDKCTTDYFPANHAQLSKAVKGHDPYCRIGARRSFWLKEFSKALVLLILFIATVASFIVIWEAFG